MTWCDTCTVWHDSMLPLQMIWCWVGSGPSAASLLLGRAIYSITESSYHTTCIIWRCITVDVWKRLSGWQGVRFLLLMGLSLCSYNTLLQGFTCTSESRTETYNFINCIYEYELRDKWPLPFILFFFFLGGGGSFNSFPLGQNGCHFADDIFKFIFLTENVWISINISVKFVPQGQINNIPVLVQIIAWRRLGDKPLSEQMMANSLTHICLTRP